MDKKKTFLLGSFIIALILMILFSSGAGAMEITTKEIFSIAGYQLGISDNEGFTSQQSAVFMIIRLPRILLGVLIGASLSVSGAAMQGLFRNPLADPSLIGISAGAAFSAALGIVVLGPWLDQFSLAGSISALSLITFLGALGTTWLVFNLSRQMGRTLVTTMLLAGIAINAFAGAGTGLLTFASTDDQLRSLTFWTLGSLGGANWENVMIMLPFGLFSILILIRLYKPLNAFALGEEQAGHIGTPIEKVKRQVILFSAVCVGASVAFAGIIGFVGLVVPHMLRLLVGPDHRFILPASAIGGALLLTLADTASRTMLAPTEIPIGVLTAFVGAPVFLGILIKDRHASN